MHKNLSGPPYKKTRIGEGANVYDEEEFPVAL
jgi:hypothetical protein